MTIREVNLRVKVDETAAETVRLLLQRSAEDRDAAGVADLLQRHDVVVRGTTTDITPKVVMQKVDGHFTFLDGRIVVTMQNGRGNVTMNVHRPTCPSCGEIQCCFMCDGSKGADENNTEEEEDVMNRLLCNGALDGIEGLIHCLVATGAITQSEDPRVNEALKLVIAQVMQQ